MELIEGVREILNILIHLAAFGIIAVAAGRLAGFFNKWHLPFITGLLLIGLIAGPGALGLVSRPEIEALHFVNEIALSFIALAVGAELYLNELRNRMKSIAWMTVSQLLVTFSFGTIAVYLLADVIPFMQSLNENVRLAVSLLAGAIFTARSPASAIAIINEMRARGPFTQTAIGVTVVKDFIVIILFAMIFTLSQSIIAARSFSFYYIIQSVLEILLSIAFGYIYGQLLKLILANPFRKIPPHIFIILSGFLVYVFSAFVEQQTLKHFIFELHIDPLIVCIIGSFIIANYSKYRDEFMKVVKEASPYIYIVFFTLTGAKINVATLLDFWYIVLIIFFVRVLSLVIGGYTGHTLAGDPPLFRKVAWMSYVTQAGVGIGLATVVSNEYPGWGDEFATLIISVIILNEITGPALFKWAIRIVKEGRARAGGFLPVDQRKAIIFGLESQSIALARQLALHQWEAEIVAVRLEKEGLDTKDLKITSISGLNRKELEDADLQDADTFICLLSDFENYRICLTAYKYFGIHNLIARIQNRSNHKKFEDLDVMIIDPTTAMVSLMEHYVRAPIATSILLGTEKVQDTIDVEVFNPNLHGLTLRDLRLPTDVIVLSVSRGDQMIISHGYTRLRLGDVVTLVGSRKALEDVRLRLQG